MRRKRRNHRERLRKNSVAKHSINKYRYSRSLSDLTQFYRLLAMMITRLAVIKTSIC